MLVKLSVKGRLTLPKSILSAYPGTEYFEVTHEHGRIVLTPVRISRADAVRTKLATRGVEERDVAAAVVVARKGTGKRV